MSVDERNPPATRERSGRRRLFLAIIGVVAALAIAAFLVPILRSKGEVRTAARLAREAVAANRRDDARKLIDRWAALSSQDGEPDYYRAYLEVQDDRPVEALDAMRQALAKGYPEPPVSVLRSVILARGGQFNEAEPVLTRAFQDASEPKAEIAEALSRVYLKTFRLPQTIRVLESWMKSAPDDPRPYLRRNEIDDRAEADKAVLIRNYREALRRDPNLIAARLGLADKLREESQVDEAEAEYAALLERDPSNLRGLVGAGRIALLKGELAVAIKHYEDALKVDPKDKIALRELALIDMNNGRFAQACTRLKAAVEVDPFDPEVRFSYSRALKSAGDEPRAAEETATTERLKKENAKIVGLRQSLVEKPNDINLRCEAARWLIEHGHDKEGLEWTDLILRTRPGHPATCRFLADYYTRKGNFGLANYYRLAETSADIR